jgi:hypothetical protein
VGEDRSATRRRVTVQEAADILGITVEAVRGRIKRNTIAHERTDEGVFVFVGADWKTSRSQPLVDQSADQALLVARLESEIQFLREELARKDAIMLNMTESMRQLTAPASPELPESPVSPGPTGTPTAAGGGPQSGTERRWWEFWR